MTPFQRHSDTSIAAAREIEPLKETLRSKVLAYLNDRVGATDEMMQRDLQMNPSTQRPRRIELVRMGLVKDSGVTMKTASGRQATIWMVTGNGPDSGH